MLQKRSSVQTNADRIEAARGRIATSGREGVPVVVQVTGGPEANAKGAVQASGPLRRPYRRRRRFPAQNRRIVAGLDAVAGQPSLGAGCALRRSGVRRSDYRAERSSGRRGGGTTGLVRSVGRDRKAVEDSVSASVQYMELSA